VSHNKTTSTREACLFVKMLTQSCSSLMQRRMHTCRASRKRAHSLAFKHGHCDISEALQGQVVNQPGEPVSVSEVAPVPEESLCKAMAFSVHSVCQAPLSQRGIQLSSQTESLPVLSSKAGSTSGSTLFSQCGARSPGTQYIPSTQAGCDNVGSRNSHVFQPGASLCLHFIEMHYAPPNHCSESHVPYLLK
jgi:hypothetical protein